MRRFPLSLLALVACVGLFLLQAFPQTEIHLMIYDAAFVNALLVHVFLIALLVEAAVRRVPRVLIVIPCAAYGAYYVAYGYQEIAIASKTAELQSVNPHHVLAFDPEAHSLVVGHGELFVKQYAVPAAYETSAYPGVYMSHRLISRDQCDILKDSQSPNSTFGVHGVQVCVLNFLESPPHPIVSVVESGDREVWKHKFWKYKWGISDQVTDLLVDGKRVASYRTASLWRLPILPIGTIGCGAVLGTPEWRCNADFSRTHVQIDAVPAGVDRSRYDTPLSVMLGLPKYTSDELANFRGFPQNDAVVARLAEEPSRVEDEIFAHLADIIAGNNPKPNESMAYNLWKNPSRAAPFARAMIKRLAELNDASPPGPPNRFAQMRALISALAALSPDVFAGVADQVMAMIQQVPDASYRLDLLYLRAADVGPSALPFYKREFLTAKIEPERRKLPVLAICRIGQADEDIIAEMKARFLREGKDFDYQSALAVTLIKLGETSFVRDHMDATPRGLGWMEALLRGEGTTETGPNNCTGWRSVSSNYVPPNMDPRLYFGGGRGWGARENR
jgi:hypothetical protein